MEKELRKKKNIEILNDSLDILNEGYYEKAGRSVKLHFSKDQMQTAQVFLPDDLTSMRAKKDLSFTDDNLHSSDTGCTLSCKNTDALVLSQTKYRDLKESGDTSPKILVLNLASATHPGGRTRDGAIAQEEDLCRRTSLLLSLESDSAKKYYDYNDALKTHMGSDAIILSPYVDVIKDSTSETLTEPFSISIMSCAAPMVRLGLEGMSKQEYEHMLYVRIQGILLVAASHNYRYLILGAFGCGMYGNDAATVSNLFDRAIRDFTYAKKNINQLFDSIDFAVLCPPGKEYNYNEFKNHFV